LQLAPQLVALSALQVPPHTLKPALHFTPQWPAEHVAVPFAPPGQTAPHALQLSASLATSTHEPPHAVFPPPHVVTHAPSEHNLPPVHAAPHAPQLKTFVDVFVSHPSAALPLQFPRPDSHFPTAQTPPAHDAAPCATEHGVHAVASQPYAGSTRETQTAPQAFRSAAQLPSGRRGSGAGTTGALAPASPAQFAAPGAHSFGNDDGVIPASPSPRARASSKSTPTSAPHPTRSPALQKRTTDPNNDGDMKPGMDLTHQAHPRNRRRTLSAAPRQFPGCRRLGATGAWG
jgi:hypothetical protein